MTWLHRVYIWWLRSSISRV